jgi:hypothetical protein
MATPRHTSMGQTIWATNGTSMKKKLLIDGLRFDEVDTFFEETGSKR